MKILLALALIAGVSSIQEQPPSGVTLPRVVKDVRPYYTNEARQQRIEGKVLLDVMVRDDGSVGDVTVKQSLDSVYGLDNEAVKAAKQWQFKPAEKNGKPIAFPIVLEMTFTLK
jgi:periplasmic protein TonB